MWRVADYTIIIDGSLVVVRALDFKNARTRFSTSTPRNTQPAATIHSARANQTFPPK